MYSHIMVGANDLEAMTAFYDAVLAPLGLSRDLRRAVDSPAGLIWQQPNMRWPQFAVRYPFNEERATCGNGVQISFAAPSHEAVRTAWVRALSHGGTDEGEPGFRPQYAADFYAAYCRDPEGNKLCFVHADQLT